MAATAPPAPAGRRSRLRPSAKPVPDDIALAYAAVLKAPPVKAPSFEQRWSAWGGGLWRQQSHVRRSGGDRQPRSLRADGGVRRRPRLSPHAQHGRGRRARRRRHQLEPGAGARRRQERCLPGRRLRCDAFGPRLPGGGASPSPITGCRPTASPSPAITSPPASTRRASARGWKAAIASPRIFGGIAPYAAIQAQSFRTPTYSETDVNGGGFALGYTGRTATDTRSELGARFDRLLALNPNAVLALRAPARLGARLGERSDACRRIPDASRARASSSTARRPAKNSALASAGTELRLANGVSLLGKFDGEFASRSSTYAGTGTVRYAW